MPHITIQMYHNNPPVREIGETNNDPVWCRQAWDEFRASEVLSHACFDAPVRYGTEDSDKLDSLIAKAFKGIIEADKHSADVNNHQPMHLTHGEDSGYDIYVLMGTEEQLKALADNWAEAIITDAPSVGGDDSYFDYFPDYVDGLRQLCSQSGYHAPYNRAIEALVAETSAYHNDPEAADWGLFGPPLED